MRRTERIFPAGKWQTFRITKDETRYLLYGLSVTIAAAILLNVLTVASAMALYETESWIMQAGTDISMLLALALFPYLIYRFVFDFVPANLPRGREWAADILLFLFAAVLLIWKYPTNIVLHYLAVAVAEEYHFRGLQLPYYEKNGSLGRAVVFSSLIFAVILHINDNILANLLVRFPLGLCFAGLRVRFGLGKSILAHWAYDVVITFL
ncbi:MAG: CPBP family intramembrane metalloprotease [Lachnospiraceae bacterium]|nr:CPBP family intramembrane metalloprotease [Lachnospiraceae bacterium]